MEFVLDNGKLRAEWRLADGGLVRGAVANREIGASLPPASASFELDINGEAIPSSDLVLTRAPSAAVRRGEPGAARIADREDTDVLDARFALERLGLEVEWQASLGRSARYLRQTVTLSALGRPVDLRRVTLVRLPAEAAVGGSVPGSPQVFGHAYAALEHPMAESRFEAHAATSSLRLRLPLQPGAPLTVTAVMGFARTGQLRRDFGEYIERQRPRPYRPLLHYNSWYDLGFFTPFDEKAALEAIEAYGEELVRKRGVPMDGFLFDDGWDDPRTLWGFHEGFPNGFSRVREAAEAIGAAAGVWLSPWGGYSTPKQRRLAYAREQGFETNEHGLALSGPVYYERFREVCSRFVTEYGVNHFKFDGTGDAGTVAPGSRFGSDFDAAIELIRELRRLRGDLYVNLTTGTWASPFWLLHADSIWRGGEDYGFHGPGTKRQQWITYRDAATYANVVRAGPLFPLNSLMLHGVTFAPHAPELADDPGNDLPCEIWSLFASGTQLLELYVSPSLMTDERWDLLAAAARWVRSRAEGLRDTHWVGGDPGDMEPYGWASWSPEKQVLCLRNPSDAPRAFPVCPRLVWQPPALESFYRFQTVWRSHGAGEPFVLGADEEHPMALAPYEVVVLEAAPATSVH
ncbi:MAG: hypothetical protein AMXMBFR61_11350 [Fimbriimonadales bacterium]